MHTGLASGCCSSIPLLPGLPCSYYHCITYTALLQFATQKYSGLLSPLLRLLSLSLHASGMRTLLNIAHALCVAWCVLHACACQSVEVIDTSSCRHLAFGRARTTAMRALHACCQWEPGHMPQGRRHSLTFGAFVPPGSYSLFTYDYDASKSTAHATMYTR